MVNDQWPSHNHGPSEGRGLDCGEKPIGWCVRIAKDAEIAELRAEVERLRRDGVDWMGRYEQLTEFARGIEHMLADGRAKVARVERLAVGGNDYAIHVSDLRAALAGTEPEVPRGQNVSASPWGPTQCALPEHDESVRHAYSPSEASDG